MMPAACYWDFTGQQADWKMGINSFLADWPRGEDLRPSFVLCPV